ncbi:MAG TPA: excisionase family DNA-binding protein [Planctomicrobium sp.]|nr:excisionase family DNA-binding protein [Planctomicrobium sp.]
MSPDSDSHPNYLSVEEFAARVGFSVPTVRRRIQDGSIRVWQPGGPGTRLSIPLSETERLLQESALPVKTPVSRSPKPLSGRTPRWKEQLKTQQK